MHPILLKGLFAVHPPLYRCEFAFLLAWCLFISFFVWKGLYIFQKNLLLLKTNKVRKKCKRNVTHYFQ